MAVKKRDLETEPAKHTPQYNGDFPAHLFRRPDGTHYQSAEQLAPDDKDVCETPKEEDTTT